MALVSLGAPGEPLAKGTARAGARSPTRRLLARRPPPRLYRHPTECPPPGPASGRTPGWRRRSTPETGRRRRGYRCVPVPPAPFGPAGGARPGRRTPPRPRRVGIAASTMATASTLWRCSSSAWTAAAALGQGIDHLLAQRAVGTTTAQRPACERGVVSRLTRSGRRGMLRGPCPSASWPARRPVTAGTRRGVRRPPAHLGARQRQAERARALTRLDEVAAGDALRRDRFASQTPSKALGSHSWARPSAGRRSRPLEHGVEGDLRLPRGIVVPHRRQPYRASKEYP